MQSLAQEAECGIKPIDAAHGAAPRPTRREIDGAAYVARRRPLRVGEIATVKIERAGAYDLHGTAVGLNCNRSILKRIELFAFRAGNRGASSLMAGLLLFRGRPSDADLKPCASPSGSDQTGLKAAAGVSALRGRRRHAGSRRPAARLVPAAQAPPMDCQHP